MAPSVPSSRPIAKCRNKVATAKANTRWLGPNLLFYSWRGFQPWSVTRFYRQLKPFFSFYEAPFTAKAQGHTSLGSRLLSSPYTGGVAWNSVDPFLESPNSVFKGAGYLSGGGKKSFFMPDRQKSSVGRVWKGLIDFLASITLVDKSNSSL